MSFYEEQLDKARRKALGERGKAAEEQVKAVLKKLGQFEDFDWHRVYDARTAGGKFPAQPGDYAFYSPGTHGLIEVKSLKHEFRLPRKNFNDNQLAKLRRRQVAGGTILVLVQHTQSLLWRRPPFEWIWHNRDTTSWDLSQFETYTTAAEAMGASGIFTRYGRLG